MSTKFYLFERVTGPVFETGPFSAPQAGYEFAAEMDVISGFPKATIVVEKTQDGGATWSPVITFELDRQGVLATPAGAPISFDSNVVRARLTDLVDGQAFLSVSMK